MEVFVEQLDRLTDCFPKSAPEFTEKMLKVWYNELKEHYELDFINGVETIIQEENFFPSIATLYKANPIFRLVGRLKI
jgi:predicted ribosome-associated RNA-binding protein Tma20